MKRLSIKSKIVILGCGSVGKCCLHYLDNFFQVDKQQVYIVDKDDSTFYFPSVQLAIKGGVNALHYTITRDNIAEFLDRKLKVNKYDIIIDYVICYI
jgi:homospermidine synthase